MSKKNLKTRRYAKKCEFVEKSKSNPGYKKYLIDIVELDGSITEGVPAYGFDMQDAVARLIRGEKVEKLTKVYVEKIEPAFIMFMVVGLISSLVVANYTNNIKYGFTSVMLVLVFSILYTIVRTIKRG
tara:strand:- start:238 stop:621 length:384 start_codon:yes stop_codon:yes gene_type:complete